ncbi:MAG: purine-nucleoside phosphorylase [Eubacterium sp.]|nr:purine-nucleoside phosphorylase [Eubacterium sp.]
MNETKAKLQRCFEAVRDRVPFVPKVALILGSGLGDLADMLPVEGEIAYREIPGFPVSTVAGHRGRFVFSHIEDVPVVMMQGRVHYYEGYPMTDVVLPVRLMRLFGAEILFLTNAAGGLDPAYSAGTLMMITDQISSFVPSPLIGPNVEMLGTRFPDMSRIYDAELCGIIRSSAEDLGIELKEGTYVQATGPNYESPAEVRMFRTLGGSAVGMSTAVEAIAARHAGMRVCGVSCVTNPGAGLSDNLLSHEEVQKASEIMKPNFVALVQKSIGRMS